MYNDFIKEIAVKVGLPSENYSGKATRVNAVTASHMAGLAKNAITGHKTLSSANHYFLPIHKRRDAIVPGTSIALGHSSDPITAPKMTSITVKEIQCFVLQNGLRDCSEKTNSQRAQHGGSAQLG